MGQASACVGKEIGDESPGIDTAASAGLQDAHGGGVGQRVARRRKRHRSPPFPTVDQATRTEFGRSSIRLRTWAAIAVARASSLWKRSPSPMTCFQRANWPSTPALSL
jgi:hypothetical protein